MGNIRVPKTIYKNGMVMEFRVIKKEIFYTLSKWSSDGSNLAVIETNKLDGRSPLLLFTSVEVEQWINNNR